MMADQTEFMLSGFEEPFDTDFMFLKAIYQTASEQGLRVLLDGGGGDVVLSAGSYVTRLIKEGSWSRAMAEIVGENRINGGNQRSLLSNLIYYLRSALIPATIKRSIRSIRNHQQDMRHLDSSLISREFAEKVNIADHFSEHRRTFPQDQGLEFAIERLRAIRPNMTAGRERYARIASLLGMEARDPFLDKRVIEYSANLPRHLRMRAGRDKVVLRDLMNNRVPQQVAWSARKPHVGWLFNQAINQTLLASGAISLSGLQDSLREFVNVAELGAAWQAFRASGYNDNLNKALYLSMWLKENSRRPIVPDPEIL
jgi:asparagine synthase (glutamine-hydrolysing)